MILTKSIKSALAGIGLALLIESAPAEEKKDFYSPHRPDNSIEDKIKDMWGELKTCPKRYIINPNEDEYLGTTDGKPFTFEDEKYSFMLLFGDREERKSGAISFNAHPKNKEAEIFSVTRIAAEERSLIEFYYDKRTPLIIIFRKTGDEGKERKPYAEPFCKSKLEGNQELYFEKFKELMKNIVLSKEFKVYFPKIEIK